MYKWLHFVANYSIIKHALITRAHSVVIIIIFKKNNNNNKQIIERHICLQKAIEALNQRRWQSLGGQHGKNVYGLFEKVSFQITFEGVESG